MGRYTFGGIWTVTLFSAICSLLTISCAEQIPGFISIDCGNVNPGEDFIGLPWEGDGNYVTTGMNGQISDKIDTNLDNHEALRSFRYFPRRQNKHCYELHTNGSKVTFLMRAMFLHGNAPELKLPILFHAFVNATFWFSVQYEERASDSNVDSSFDWLAPEPSQDPLKDSDTNADSFHFENSNLHSLQTPKVWEAIFFSPGNVTYFCLVPETGVPFISSLEMRLLDPEGLMYSFNNNPNRRKLFFSSLIRWNTGAPPGSRTLRYPDDKYDRLWIAPDTQNYSISVNVSQKQSNFNSSAKLNYVPSKVMVDAWQGRGASYLNNTPIKEGLWFHPTGVPLPVNGEYINVNTYFAYEDPTNMTVSVNGAFKRPFVIFDNITMKSYEFLIVGTDFLDFHLWSYSWSDTRPILNAMEIFKQNVFNPSAVEPFVVPNMNYLKRTLNLSGWEGDPCTPVPYDGIRCEHLTAGGKEMLQRLTSITLTNVSGFDNLRFNVSAPFDGSLRKSLLYLLNVSITHSNLHNKNFPFISWTFVHRPVIALLESSFSYHGYVKSSTSNVFWILFNLNLSYNNLNSFPERKEWDVNLLLSSLDFSHNNINGAMPDLVDMPFNNSLKVLHFSKKFGSNTPTLLHLAPVFRNLSHNDISSFPIWKNTTWGSLALTVLDLSHNKFSSPLSSLNTFVQMNSLSLEQLYLSNNNFMGSLTSDLYFSSQTLPTLKILNMDQNIIGGVLNLTTWHNKLQQAHALWNTTGSGSEFQLFSFVNNSIKDIYPSVEVLTTTFESLKEIPGFNESGILLGGNPYCKNAKSQAQKFLCRSSIYDIIVEKKKNKYIALFGGTISAGVFILLIGSIMFFIIWRLRRQLHSLQKIQQALADQKVQPRFYSYSDLKSATKDFHKSNKLGSGGYGAVYKAILEDGTTVAVKRLFNPKQILNEFLNEVILITGIKHRNLVQLEGCSIKNDERILIYEYAENGNLAEALWGHKDNNLLSWEQRFRIILGVARGLAYLHEELHPRIIHRDIKSENILLDKYYNSKISDFGLAKPFLDEESHARHTHFAGTRGYFAPEYALQGELTEKADVFSFGILVLEIVSGRKCIDKTLPVEKKFIRRWVEKLYKDGMLLELLQPGIRENSPNNEVLSVIKVALICVKMNPEFRPIMSQVVRMLLGNLDSDVRVPSTSNTLSQDLSSSTFSGTQTLRWRGDSNMVDKITSEGDFRIDCDESRLYSDEYPFL